MVQIMTPKEVVDATSPAVDTICEQINLKLIDGSRDFNIHYNTLGLNLTEGHINFIKARLMKAGWCVSECKIVCEDRPCVYPYLKVSLSLQNM